MSLLVETGYSSDTSGETSVFAKVAAMGDRIEWHANVPFEKLTVTVLGADDSQYSRVFGGGSLPFFDLRDNEGKLFPDGVCHYTLQLTPFSNNRSRTDDLPAGRDSNGKPATENASGNAMTQSGVFSIADGRIISNEATIEMESTIQQGNLSIEPQNPDYVINDDVIIIGSECIGSDCANGEDFGYCTQIYKENNLQVCFNDTSVGSFAANDWKIQINDVTSGGAGYFTIWDTTGNKRPFSIEAGAPSNALYVEAYGRIGLGTSIPYVELHIVDGDSPTIRLDQDGSSGWVAQRWDIAGNETNFFIRDVTNGSKLIFRIQPDTPSNMLTLRNSGDGRVGVGTWSPGARLHIEGASGSTDPLLLVQRTGLISAQTYLKVKDSGDVELLKAIGEGSDRNQKKNIEPIDTAMVLAGVVNMPVSQWNYKVDDDGVRHMGPMAQDFYTAFRLGADDKHISSIDGSGVSFAAIQELNKQLELQKEMILKQNEIIAALQKQIARLGKAVKK